MRAPGPGHARPAGKPGLARTGETTRRDGSPLLRGKSVRQDARRTGRVPVPAAAGGAGLAQSISRVGVVIPAHNEEVLLPACIAALGVAAARAEVPVSAVVVLDACMDGSLQAVRDGDPAPFDRLEHIACQVRSVGAARAAGSRYLIRSHDPAGLWLATTDADSTVPPDWIVRQLAHARLGARAVIGTVHVADWSHHPTHVEPRYRTSYDARDDHRHVHGANISMAATAYLAAGGFPALATAEDVAIIERLCAASEPVVWAADLPVITSARLDSRAPAGFASYLAGLAWLAGGT